MSTEQKDLEENALASRLTRTWERFKQGKLISYRMMAFLIIAVTAIGLTWYILRERAREASRIWYELESLNTVSSLEEFSKEHPNTKAGKVARLQVARRWLGPEGIDMLGANDPKAKQSAVENIEKARTAFEELAGEFKDDPVIRPECYYSCARAEEALIGISKAGKPQNSLIGPIAPEDSRGSPDKLAEWLDKLAEAAPNTPWGDDAKKLAAAIHDKQSNTRNEIINVQAALARMQTPSLPGFDPHPPIIPPGNTPPTPTPGVPGVPGFTPEKSGTTPNAGPTPPAAPGTTTPMPMTPGTTPPAPTAPGPKPPEKKDTTPPETPRPPEPKAPAPTPGPTGTPKPPMAPMPPMPPMPPKK